MVRSYWEEYVYKRDVKRLLTYYKHTIPGSMADGDERNAMYLVWKYRHKKERLWRMLEKKYGEPVLQTHEYPDEVEDKNEEGGEDTVDLDEDSDASDGDEETADEDETDGKGSDEF